MLSKQMFQQISEDLRLVLFGGAIFPFILFLNFLFLYI